jgi:hypothetical protein
MFNDLDDLPPGYPKVDFDHTRETLKDGTPTKGTFTLNLPSTTTIRGCMTK